MTAPVHSASKSHQRFCCEDFGPSKKQQSLFNCESDIHLCTSSSVFIDKHTVPQVIAFVLTSTPQLKQDSNCRIHTKLHTMSPCTLHTVALQSRLDTLTFHKSQKLVTTCVIIFIATIVYMVNIPFQ